MQSTIDHERLDLAAEATPISARHLRVRFQQWLRIIGIAAPLVEDLVLAVYEALANAVEHAYPPEHPNPMIHLQAQLADDQLLITITDHGRWLAPPPHPGYRGRGLAVMRALTTEVDLHSTDHGTTVQLRTALPVSFDGQIRTEPTANP